jgi:hypothetical protein
VGQLFKINLITKKIITIIVNQLLENKSENAPVRIMTVEAACTLMENVGDILENKGNKKESINKKEKSEKEEAELEKTVNKIMEKF